MGTKRLIRLNVTILIQKVGNPCPHFRLIGTFEKNIFSKSVKIYTIFYFNRIFRKKNNGRNFLNFDIIFRHGVGVVLLDGPLYAIGGNDGWSFLNTVERWDSQVRSWNYVAPMNAPRSTHGVAVLGKKK